MSAKPSPLDPVVRGITIQQEAAKPALSAFVSANAGTGKTKVLVDRVTRLLLGEEPGQGSPPERILCLTFTKAAAAEMANRLYERLGAWATLPDPALAAEVEKTLGVPLPPERFGEARRLFARALDTPGGLKIQTIHAFCQSVLGRFPIEAGLPPGFDVMDERTAAEEMAAVRDAMLGDAFAGRAPEVVRALNQLAATANDEGLTELFAEAVKQRARFARLIAQAGGTLDQLKAKIRLALEVGPAETPEDVIRAACHLSPAQEDALKRAAAALEQGSKGDQDRRAAILAFIAAGIERRQQVFEDYCGEFLTQTGGVRKHLTTAGARKANPDVDDIMQGEAARLIAALAKARSATVALQTEAMLDLSTTLTARYEAAKARGARLDFDDLVLTVGRLLARADQRGWILYKLDQGIDHILVDEAQDTSPAQWDIVKSIAEEFTAGAGARKGTRTVFAVGDEKQSIYSFQGADPREFARSRDHFASRMREGRRNFDALQLFLSFRSAPEILALTDQVFADEAVRQGVVTDTAQKIEHAAARTSLRGLVEIWPTETTQAIEEPGAWDAPLDRVAPDSPPARLAAKIAKTIAGFLHAGALINNKDGTIRPMTAGDVLILVRRRGGFVDLLVRELKLAHIPVAGADRLVLPEHIAVMDLIALGQFCLLAEDDLNLAALLRSPLCGISEEQLFDLAHGRTGSLWAAVQADTAHGALAERLKSWRARADQMPPFEFYAGILAEGGRRALMARLGPEAAEPMDEFLGLALSFERLHPPSLQGFLHWAMEGAAEIKRDADQARDEVRIMTVHGAKGLEAPVVFLPDTCAVPGGNFDPNLLIDEEMGLAFYPGRKGNDDDHCARIRDLGRAGQMEEYRRLLYVALTRAAQRLYVTGYETSKGRADGCWYDLILAGAQNVPGVRTVADPATGLEKIVIGGPLDMLADGTQAGMPASGDQAAPSPGAGVAVPPPWAERPPPAEPSPPRPLAPSRMEEAEPPAASPRGAGLARFTRGLLVHRMLQSLPDLNQAERSPAAERFLAARAPDWRAEDRAKLCDEVLAILDDPAFAAIFGPGSLAEVHVAGPVPALGPKAIISGKVDRLLVTPSEVVVVDFKTNRPPPARADDVAPVYLRQMALYREALRLIHPGLPVRTALIWTDGPRLMPLPDSVLDPFARPPGPAQR